MQPLTRHRRADRRAFTLIEVLIAAVIAAFLMGTVSLSLANLGRAKNSSKHRFAAFMRADNALTTLRSDIASCTRANDLFYSRILITSRTYRTEGGQEFPRSELLTFTTRLMNIRAIDYTGEGIEYETQYRIEEDEFGPVLWQRRDALPDVYPDGGGVVTPLVEGVVGLRLEAFDGFEWREEWDSDYDGLPLAIRMTVWTSGQRDDESAYDKQPIELSTVVSIDRVEPPFDHTRIALEALFEQLAAEQAEENAAKAAEAAAEAPTNTGGTFTPMAPPRNPRNPNIGGTDAGRTPTRPARGGGRGGGRGVGPGNSGGGRGNVGGGTGNSVGGGGRPR
ncbi:MAG: prepilin-type N-terminal cleavage/methylation domain-containing protein [Phycisphaerales bacterium]|nr:prepilin-type N-terminal cleavage/methylation domain-containing protein [Phycisphaerales bacterium]